MEITSKRHPFKFYLNLVLWIVICSSFSFTFFKVGLEKLDKAIIGGILSVGLMFYVIFCYLKNAPKIILNKEGIIFRNTFHIWEDLESAKLTGKKRLAISSEECATLTFKNSSTIIIFDDFYSNISEIKLFIQNIVIDKKDEINISKQQINLSNVEFESFNKYKGYPLFSTHGFVIWLPLLYLLGASLYQLKLYPFKTLIACLIVSLFLMLVFSWMLNYFEISKNFIKVKNHYYFWKKDIYRFTEIKEIIFEERYGKRPKSLQIITHDFKTNRYYAGSLSDKTWLKLKTEMESKNIIIR